MAHFFVLELLVGQESHWSHILRDVYSTLAMAVSLMKSSYLSMAAIDALNLELKASTVVNTSAL
eukprot:6318942-Ditylum_brightwellii.AAC.1